MEDTIDLTWRKATYSGNGGGNCLEVADDADRVLVRDTKDRAGAVLAFTADAWRQFVAEQRLADQHSSARPRAVGTGRLRSAYSSSRSLRLLMSTRTSR